MIKPLEKFYMTDQYGDCYGEQYPSNLQMMNKINEIIEVLNKMELDEMIKESKKESTNG